MENDFYASYYNAAYILLRQKKYDEALEMIRNITGKKSMHPANFYGAFCLTGKLYEKLGKKTEARNAYTKALEYAKKITYRHDASEAEKAVKRLSE